MKILILCTGNSCRSQMAEGFLRSFDSRLEVFSAGTHPAPQANLNAVAAMKEVGIDISQNKPKSVDLFLADSFDYVITVCGGAKETCPAFTGLVKNRLHIGFDDPVDAIGTPEEVMAVYRRVRDEIKESFRAFYTDRIKAEVDIENHNNLKECGCDSNCCSPKKNTILMKLIFFVILVAALGIIFVKLFFYSSPAPAANQQLFQNPNSPAWCDSTGSKTCDTTKGSSCCPKSK